MTPAEQNLLNEINSSLKSIPAELHKFVEVVKPFYEKYAEVLVPIAFVAGGLFGVVIGRVIGCA